MSASTRKEYLGSTYVSVREEYLYLGSENVGKECHCSKCKSVCVRKEYLGSVSVGKKYLGSSQMVAADSTIVYGLQHDVATPVHTDKTTPMQTDKTIHPSFRNNILSYKYDNNNKILSASAMNQHPCMQIKHSLNLAIMLH